MKSKVLNIVFIILLIGLILGIVYINFKNEKTSLYTYFVYNLKNNDTEDIESISIIFTFDENDICVDCRMAWNFTTEEIAQKNYKGWKEANLLNLNIQSKKVVFNDKEQVGKTKEEIRNTEFGKDVERIEF